VNVAQVIDSLLAKDPVFQRVLADGLSIQDRFSAEPTYKRTGKGSLKSSGVGEVARAKRRAKRGRG
jgi:hypothetical protein